MPSFTIPSTAASMIVSGGLVIAGLIHVMPVAGLAGAGMLKRLYGLDPASRDLLVMMQHRALLFLILALFLFGAAVRPSWQPAAIGVGLVSAGGFVLIAWAVGGTSAQIGRVVTADLVALAALGAAALALSMR